MNDLPMNDSQSVASPEKNLILYVYGGFGVSLILSALPFIEAATACLVALIAVLIAAYVIRRKAAENSLPENHMTFIIRTIWISGFLSVFTLIGGCAYMLMHIDNTPLNGCIEQILAIPAEEAATLSTLALYQMFGPCIDGFIKINLNVLIISGVIAAGPVFVYVVVRFIKGLMRAIKGEPVAQPKAWF
jgi:uncharacterized membrane protein